MFTIRFIYSEHYYDKMFTHSGPIALKFMQNPCYTMSKERFVETVIRLSQHAGVSIDMFEENNHIITEFILGNMCFAPESTAVFEELFRASENVTLYVEENPKNIRIRVAYLNKK